MSSASSSTSYKLVLLGDGRVGKTSLVSRFAENRFSATEESTLKAQMYKRARLVVDGRPVEVSVWDTAGQERFHALGPLYYRGADGAVLVYDITDSDSFVRVRQWVKELKKTVGDDICLVVCGNKCDLEKDKQVAEDEAVRVAARYNATHFYTSAKTDQNVQTAFTDVIERAVRKRNGTTGGAAGAADLYGADAFGGGAGGDSSPSPSGGKRNRRRGLVVDDGSGFGAAAPPAPAAEERNESFGLEHTSTSPPEPAAQKTSSPAQPSAKREEPPRSVRVTLREDEDARNNARPGEKKGGKKSGPPCCGK